MGFTFDRLAVCLGEAVRRNDMSICVGPRAFVSFQQGCVTAQSIGNVRGVIVRRDAGIQPGAEHVRWFPCLGQKPYEILSSQMPTMAAKQERFGGFQSSHENSQARKVPSTIMMIGSVGMVLNRGFEVRTLGRVSHAT
jgi:hypothetical protein